MSDFKDKTKSIFDMDKGLALPYDIKNGGPYKPMEMDMPTTLEIAKKKLLRQMANDFGFDPEGIAQGPPNLQDSYKRQLDALAKYMDEHETKKREEAQWTPAEGPVMIMDVPMVQCPECGYQYEIMLAPDGIRIEFKHHPNPNCSKSMTKFYRPKAVFCREV